MRLIVALTTISVKSVLVGTIVIQNIHVASRTWESTPKNEWMSIPVFEVCARLSGITK